MVAASDEVAHVDLTHRIVKEYLFKTTTVECSMPKRVTAWSSCLAWVLLRLDEKEEGRPSNDGNPSRYVILRPRLYQRVASAVYSIGRHGY